MSHSRLICSSLLFLALLPAGAAEIKVGPDANGKPQTLDKGDVLVVELPANPSTGFMWTNTGTTLPVLTVAGPAEFKPDPAAEGMVGVGGTAIFKFDALESGRAEVTLLYRRSWEAEVPPVMTFVLPVTVK